MDEIDNLLNAFLQRRNVLDGLKTKYRSKTPPPEPCPQCGREVERNALCVCPKCGHHYGIAANARLDALLDEGSRPLFGNIPTRDPLRFPGYAEKHTQAREKTGMSDAFACREGAINGRRIICVALEPAFMMGSMGTAVGEAVTRAAERARAKKVPLVIFSASGGARMQEGMLSLMQMAKTSAAIRAFSDEGGLFVSVLTHPTTGGVTASFASLGDIILAEPRALIGFAGARVIEQTIGEKLPNGFQRAEFQLEHGFVDAIVPRGEMRETLAQLLRLHAPRTESQRAEVKK